MKHIPAVTIRDAALWTHFVEKICQITLCDREADLYLLLFCNYTLGKLESKAWIMSKFCRFSVTKEQPNNKNPQVEAARPALPLHSEEKNPAPEAWSRIYKDSE